MKMKKNLIGLFLCGAVLAVPKATHAYYEVSIGNTATKGTLSAGWNQDRNYFGFGVAKDLYAGSTGFISGPFIGYARKWMPESSPYLSLQYSPLFASKAYSWDGREWEEGWNAGLFSTGLGYVHQWKKFGVQGELTTGTPLNDFGRDWRFRWGLGLNYLIR